MATQVVFTGDGCMGMVAGYQEGHSFVAIYDTGEPHDMNKSLPQPFKSMDELIGHSEVILNFTNSKSIDNLIKTLNQAKAMLVDVDEFKRGNDCDILGGDA